MPNSMMSKSMNWRRTATPMYLDRQYGAFDGTNPGWAGLAVFGDARSTVASAFARRHGDRGQDAVTC
jgi:hypothetical protein